MCGTSSRIAPPAPFTILAGSKSIDMIAISFLSRFFKYCPQRRDRLPRLLLLLLFAAEMREKNQTGSTKNWTSNVSTLSSSSSSSSSCCLTKRNRRWEEEIVFSVQTTDLPCCVSNVRNSSTSSTGSRGNDARSWKKKKKKHKKSKELKRGCEKYSCRVGSHTVSTAEGGMDAVTALLSQQELRNTRRCTPFFRLSSSPCFFVASKYLPTYLPTSFHGTTVMRCYNTLREADLPCIHWTEQTRGK